jgi:hypothetical protein
MTRWESYNIQKKNPGASIRNMLDPERPSAVENNREYTKTLLEYHRYTFVLKKWRIEGTMKLTSRSMQESGKNS